MGLGIVKRDSDGRFQGYECPYCFKFGEYSDAWDSFACLVCRVWLDDGCKCVPGQMEKRTMFMPDGTTQTRWAPNDCPFANRPDKPEFFETPFGDGVY